MKTAISTLLGKDAQSLLEHKCNTIPKEMLHLPGPDFIDRIFTYSDRSNNVLRNLQTMFNHGRLGGTGYLSILPVDQGIEHPPGPRLRLIRFILTPRILSSWLLKADVTP